MGCLMCQLCDRENKQMFTTLVARSKITHTRTTVRCVELEEVFRDYLT